MFKKRDMRITGTIAGFLIAMAIGVGILLAITSLYESLAGERMNEKMTILMQGFLLSFACFGAIAGKYYMTKFLRIDERHESNWICKGKDMTTGELRTIEVSALDYGDARKKAIASGLKPKKINEIKK